MSSDQATLARQAGRSRCSLRVRIRTEIICWLWYREEALSCAAANGTIGYDRRCGEATAMPNLPCEEGVMRGAVRAPDKTRAGPWVLAATILGSSMVFIDGTVVNVALPALQKALNATVTDVQWVVEAYALFLASLMLVGGSLGDL